MSQVLSHVAPVSGAADSRFYQQFRADAYALLAALLVKPPSAELLCWLQQLEPAQGQGGAMQEAWSVLQLAAQRGDSQQIAEEYQTLFIGLGRGELVPFASWYLTGFLMERPLVMLRADLHRLGFERDEQVKEPEDHIAALCEVMAMLSAPGHGDDAGWDGATQQQFFNQHLGCWAERFFQDLQDSKAAHFYSAVGRFGEIFIARERLNLEPE